MLGLLGEENPVPDTRGPAEEEGIDLFIVFAKGENGQNRDYTGPVCFR